MISLLSWVIPAVEVREILGFVIATAALADELNFLERGAIFTGWGVEFGHTEWNTFAFAQARQCGEIRRTGIKNLSNELYCILYM